MMRNNILTNVSIPPFLNFLCVFKMHNILFSVI